MVISEKNLKTFQRKIWNFYLLNKRGLPWRMTQNPYHIFISEVMLQQTQVNRVVSKYTEFLSQFPSFETLAKAPFDLVLNEWHGLGYNRRALYLQKAAQIIINEFKGIVSQDPLALEKLPGIGHATARSIVVFSYNIPLVFIETNIRRVFIHAFFKDKEAVFDKDIVPFVEGTLDQKNPREWYYALMDYGSILPKTVVNPNRKSRHYTKQSKFEGSLRQVRGAILGKLIKSKELNKHLLEDSLSFEHDFFQRAYNQLVNEGFIVENNSVVCLKK